MPMVSSYLGPSDWQSSGVLPERMVLDILGWALEGSSHMQNRIGGTVIKFGDNAVAAATAVRGAITDRRAFLP